MAGGVVCDKHGGTFNFGLTEFDRAGFSEDAGWGHPAYKARFGPGLHILVLVEPRSGFRPNRDQCTHYRSPLQPKDIWEQAIGAMSQPSTIVLSDGLFAAAMPAPLAAAYQTV